MFTFWDLTILRIVWIIFEIERKSLGFEKNGNYSYNDVFFKW